MKSLIKGALVVTFSALLFLPVIAYALDKGTGRLVSVTPVDGGCVSGPTGATVEAWDIQPGYTHTLRITDVTECANGGTNPQGVPYAAHQRASTWDEGCTNPTMILGPECGMIDIEKSSWGEIKTLNK